MNLQNSDHLLASRPLSGLTFEAQPKKFLPDYGFPKIPVFHTSNSCKGLEESSKMASEALDLFPSDQPYPLQDNTHFTRESEELSRQRRNIGLLQENDCFLMIFQNLDLNIKKFADLEESLSKAAKMAMNCRLFFEERMQLFSNELEAYPSLQILKALLDNMEVVGKKCDWVMEPMSRFFESAINCYTLLKQDADQANFTQYQPDLPGIFNLEQIEVESPKIFYQKMEEEKNEALCEHTRNTILFSRLNPDLNDFEPTNFEIATSLSPFITQDNGVQEQENPRRGNYSAEEEFNNFFNVSAEKSRTSEELSDLDSCHVDPSSKKGIYLSKAATLSEERFLKLFESSEFSESHEQGLFNTPPTLKHAKNFQFIKENIQNGDYKKNVKEDLPQKKQNLVSSKSMLTKQAEEQVLQSQKKSRPRNSPGYINRSVISSLKFILNHPASHKIKRYKYISNIIGLHPFSDSKKKQFIDFLDLFDRREHYWGGITKHFEGNELFSIILMKCNIGFLSEEGQDDYKYYKSSHDKSVEWKIIEENKDRIRSGFVDRLEELMNTK